MVRRFSKKSSDFDRSLRGFDDYQVCLGDFLRGERATKGKSLLDVQRELKIDARYISAIENADLSMFESAGYIPGYVKSYAIYLNLDPDWAFERFCEESGFKVFESLSLTENHLNKITEKSDERSESVKKKGRLSKFGNLEANFLNQIEFRAFGSIAVLVVLIGALSFGGLSVFKQIQQVTYEPVNEVNIFSADLNNSRNNKDINISNDLVTKSSDTKTELAGSFRRPEVLGQPIFQQRDPPIGVLVKKKIFSEIKNELEIIKEESDDYYLSDKRFNRPKLRPVVQVTELLDDMIIIFSLKPAYIRVSEENGTILYSKILDPGEYFSVPQDGTLKSLRAGMSGYVYFRVSGKNFGPVGSGPSVKRGININKKDILDKFTIADFTKNPKAKKIIAKLKVNLESENVDLE
jgi:transcriptional regulator with XRE-family HTH domain